MYADRFYILYTAEIQESRGHGNGLPKPHLLYIWTLQENTHRQWVRIQNKMWDELFKRLKMEHRVTPIYSPQCNGRIEGFHRFLKACIRKQLQQGLEWDDLVWKATTAYNFFPTESSGFSPFFLMYGHEANAKHMILAKETTKYLGDNEGVLNNQLMMKLLQVVAYNLAKSRMARDGNRLKRKNLRPRHIKINHPVLVRNHTANLLKQEAMTT